MAHVHLIQLDGAQNFSRMCMCIEFLIQVPKQKSAHVTRHVFFSCWDGMFLQSGSLGFSVLWLAGRNRKASWSL